MTPKEVVQKGYEYFATGDMTGMRSIMDENATVRNNGMHKFSKTYKGADSFINNFIAHIQSHFGNFRVEPVKMIAEGEYVFVMYRATTDRMEADFGHFFKIENEKITEFHIFDDSQKLAATMKAL